MGRVPPGPRAPPSLVGVRRAGGAGGMQGAAAAPPRAGVRWGGRALGRSRGEQRARRRRRAAPPPGSRAGRYDFKAYVHNGAPKGALLLVWSVLLLVTGTASLSSCRSWSESQYQVGLADTAVACVARWRSLGPSVCGGSRADGFGLCQPALPRSLGPVRKHCFFQFGLNRGSPRLRLDPRDIILQYLS